MTSVCVYGLGHIGLPTAAMLAGSGHDVTGYDVDEELVARLQRGDVATTEPRLGELLERVLGDRLAVTSEPGPAEYHVVCVPTPVQAERERADLTYVTRAGATVAEHLREGDTVVLESTVPPGTTTGPLRRVLEGSGLRAGDDFGLVYSPETVLPGNAIEELRANDRYIGGVDEPSVAAATELYASFVEGQFHTTLEPTAVEFVKLIQNTFRDTNIALANEIARIAHDYGIDSRDAIELANFHPRVDIHDPGVGVGGHCLPVDPLFLGQGSDSLDLIDRARRRNDGMPAYVAGLLAEHLGWLGDERIAVLGLAYKGNVGDVRHSPGVALVRALRGDASAGRTPGRRRAREDVPVQTDGAGSAGLEVVAHDPHVEGDERLGVELLPLDDALDGADAVVVATGHDEFEALDPTAVGELTRRRFVVDAAGVLDEAAWADAGFSVRRL